MPRLAAKVGIVSVSKIVAALTLVAANAALARLLDPRAYGTFQQAWLVVTVATTVLLSGIPLSVYYFVPRESPEGRKAFLGVVLATLAVLALAGAALLGLAAGPIARSFHNEALRPALLVLAVYLAAVLPASPLESFLIAEDRHRLLAKITVAVSVLFLGATLVPPLVGAGLVWICAGLGAYAVARTGILLGAATSLYRETPARLTPGLPRLFLAYSVPLGANEVLRIASSWLDKTLVSARFEPEAFAIYANGAMEIPLVGILLASITSVLMPEFSKLRHDGERGPILALWRRAIVRTALLLLPLFAIGLVLAREIMVVLFSERYAESAGPFRVYLLLLPLRAAAYTPILLALGRSRTVLLGALGDLLLSLGLALLLMPRIGYMGPAVASVIATYAQALFFLHVTGRALGVPMRALFPWRDLGRVLVAAALPAAAVTPILLAPLEAPVRLAAGLGAYALLFLAAARGPLLPEAERVFLRDVERIGRERLGGRTAGPRRAGPSEGSGGGGR
jgi:O-antigen/teichoic acid export membrane protein